MDMNEWLYSTKWVNAIQAETVLYIARLIVARLIAFAAAVMPIFDSFPLSIRTGIIDVLQRWHEMEFLTSKFPFENAEICPTITRLAFRRNAKQIIGLTTKNFCLTHDFKM